MKILRKISFIAFVTCVILSFVTNSFASEINTKLELVEKNGKIIKTDNNLAQMSNEIINLDSENGEVELELKVSNPNKNSEVKSQNNEIYILVSENLSQDTEKLEKYISYIETLSKKIISKNSNSKIGIIGIKGPVSEIFTDDNGNYITGENDESIVEGSNDNAEIVCKLTNDINLIREGLKNMNTSKTRYYSNFQAGINLANKSLSSDSNKIIISLYNEIPDISNNVCDVVSYGGWFSEYQTIEEAVNGKISKIVKNTKSEILKLKNNDIFFIQLRPSDISFDKTYYVIGKNQSYNFDGSSYVKELYGTIEEPVYGKMYALDETEMEKIVEENIYNDISNIIQSDISKVSIKVQFSDEVLNNFDIIESVNEEDEYILNKNNSVLESYIEKIRVDETISLKYKLKIKDMKNLDLLGKEISTNKIIELTYNDSDNKNYNLELTSSPKVKLTRIIDELKANVTYDPTEKTTSQVKVVIATNKEVNEVDGWELSEDNMTLTKIYSKNTNENVKLIDYDGIEKIVNVNVTNIIDNEKKISEKVTQVEESLPQTGNFLSTNIIIVGIVTIISIVGYILFKKY